MMGHRRSFPLPHSHTQAFSQVSMSVGVPALTCALLVLMVVICVRQAKRKRAKAASLAPTIGTTANPKDGLSLIDITGPSSPVMATINSPIRDYGKRRATPSTLRKLSVRYASQSLPLGQGRPPPTTGTRVQIYSWLVEQHNNALLQRAYIDKSESRSDGEEDSEDDVDGGSGDGAPQIIRQPKKKQQSGLSIQSSSRQPSSLQRSNSLALDLTMFDAEQRDSELVHTPFKNSGFAKSLDAGMFLSPYGNDEEQPPPLRVRGDRWRSSLGSNSGRNPSTSSSDSDDLEKPGPYHLSSKKAQTYENVKLTNGDMDVIDVRVPGSEAVSGAGVTPGYENVSPSPRPAEHSATYENVDLKINNGEPHDVQDTTLPAYMNVDLRVSAKQSQSGRNEAAYENVAVKTPCENAAVVATHENATVEAASRTSGAGAAYENVALEAGSPAAPEDLSPSRPESSRKKNSWYETTKISTDTDLPSPQHFTAVKQDTLLATPRVPGSEGFNTLSDGEDSDTPLATIASGSDRNTSSGQSASTTLSAPYATLKREDIINAINRHAVSEENEFDSDYNHLVKAGSDTNLSNTSVDTMPYGRIGVAPGKRDRSLEGDYATVDQLKAADLTHDYDELDKKAREEILNASSQAEQLSHTSSELHATGSDLGASASEPSHQGRHQSRPNSAGKRSQAQLAGDSGLDELSTPYSTLSNTSSDKHGRCSSTSSEVVSAVSSQPCIHTPGTSQRRTTPNPLSVPKVSPLKLRDDLIPDVPQSPRPTLKAARVSLDSGSPLHAEGSPSLSHQSSVHSERTPAVPPGDERPRHVRLLSNGGSSSQVSRSEADGVEDTAGGSRLETTILDDFEIDFDDRPAPQYRLGPAQPILLTRNSLMLLAKTADLTEDARSFCGNEEEEPVPKTYL